MMLKRKTDDTRILKLHREGKSQREIATDLGCSKTAVLKRLKKLLPCSGHQGGDQKGTGVSQSVHACATEGPRYFKEQRYLRKKDAEQVFVWTPFIAKKEDLEEVLWDGEEFVPVAKTLTANRV
jgi:hypothetical protein